MGHKRKRLHRRLMRTVKMLNFVLVWKEVSLEELRSSLNKPQNMMFSLFKKSDDSCELNNFLKHEFLLKTQHKKYYYTSNRHYNRFHVKVLTNKQCIKQKFNIILPKECFSQNFILSARDVRHQQSRKSEKLHDRSLNLGSPLGQDQLVQKSVLQEGVPSTEFHPRVLKSHRVAENCKRLH